MGLLYSNFNCNQAYKFGDHNAISIKFLYEISFVVYFLVKLRFFEDNVSAHLCKSSRLAALSS